VAKFALSVKRPRAAGRADDAPTTLSREDAAGLVRVGIEGGNRDQLRVETPGCVAHIALQDTAALSPVDRDAINACASLPGTSARRELDGAVWTKLAVAFEQTSSEDKLSFKLLVHWNPTPAVASYRPSLVPQALLNYLASDSRGDVELSPRDFYDHAFVPPKVDQVDDKSLFIPGLTPKLFPFQRRTLQWMAGKEGSTLEQRSSDGRDSSTAIDTQAALPYSLKAAYDIHGNPYYISQLYRIVTRDLEPYRELDQSISPGGVL
jgi:hypothetical protein